jgi:hypothetical protein
MVKISDFMISLIIGGVIMTGLFLFVGGLGEEYGYTSSETNSSFYQNTINRTSNEANKIQSKLTNINPDSTITDRLGAFFSSGYDSILLTIGSLGIFGDLANEGGKKMGLPSYVTGSIIAIAVILIFVGVILGALLKVDT